MMKAAEEQRRTDMDAQRAAAEIASKERIASEDNRTKIIVEEIKQQGESSRAYEEDVRDKVFGEAGAEVKVST